MAELLCETEITRIATILSEDFGAVRMKDKIYGSLGLPLADIDELNKRIYLENSGAYGFFCRVLLSYAAQHGSKATVRNMETIFTQLNLHGVVAKIRYEELPGPSFTAREFEIGELQKLLNNTGNVSNPNNASVDVLSIEDAVKLIQTNLPEQRAVDMNEANTLAKKLHRSPLAVQQAASYIRNELYKDLNPIQKYSELFEKCGESLNFDPEKLTLSPIEKSTFTTSNLAIETVKRKRHGTVAKRLLSLICFFAGNNIPCRILLGIVLKDYSIFIKALQKSLSICSKTASEKEVIGAISLLETYSLVSGDISNLCIPPVVQRLIQMKLSSKDCIRNLQQILESLRPDLVKPPEKAENPELIKSLLPHAISVWMHAVPSYNNLVQLYGFFPVYTSDHLIHYRKFEALLKLTLCSPRMARVLGEDHTCTIQLKCCEAKAFYHLKNYTDSIHSLNYILPLVKQSMGSDDETTLDMYVLLAMNFSAQGRFIEEFKIQELIEALQVKKFGPRNKATLNTQYHKAIVITNLGRLDEAEALFRRIYQQAKMLGKCQALVWNSRTRIAWILEKKGDWKGALLIHQEVHSAVKTVMGPDHEFTINSQFSVDLCLAKIHSILPEEIL